MFTPQQIDSAAGAIANARGARRGAPPITNILDLLPENLKAEVREDATQALEAVLPAESTLVEVPDTKRTLPLMLFQVFTSEAEFSSRLNYEVNEFLENKSEEGYVFAEKTVHVERPSGDKILVIVTVWMAKLK